MQVECRLTSEAKPDWISAVCLFNIEPVGKVAGLTEALLTVTLEGTLKLWSLELLRKDVC
jgi:hypothetical protein